jgi:hypothetical protein
MRKLLVLFIGFSSFVHSTVAQIENTDLVLFGVERVSGSYTGVSPFISDDQYRLQNLVTWRMEFITPKTNILVGFSWPTMMLFNLDGQWNQGSSFTENRFHPIQNRSVFRFGRYSLLGDKEKKGLRFGIGGQLHIRQFGTYKKNVARTGVTSGKTLGVGSLALRPQYGIGPTFHLADSYGNLVYQRLSLNVDYVPGKISGIDIYPEWLWTFNYKFIGAFVNLGYRFERLSGSVQDDQDTTPITTDFTVHKAISFEFGLSIKTN